MSFEPPDFVASFRACVQGYSGRYERSVLRTADIFDFFCRLFADDRLPEVSRPVVSSVLAYFVAPRDVMPEEDLGPYGFLDNLFVATHAFRLLQRQGVPGDVLIEAWQAEGDLIEVMDHIYTESRAAVGKHRRAALRLAGLARS